MTTAVVFVGLSLVVAWCAFTAGRMAERTDQRHAGAIREHLHPSHGGASVVDQPAGESVRRLERDTDVAPYDWDTDEGTGTCR